MAASKEAKKQLLFFLETQGQNRRGDGNMRALPSEKGIEINWPHITTSPHTVSGESYHVCSVIPQQSPALQRDFFFNLLEVSGGHGHKGYLSHVRGPIQDDALVAPGPARPGLVRSGPTSSGPEVKAHASAAFSKL